MSTGSHRRPRPRDDGTATVEFVFLGVLLLVPLVYALLAAFEVQRAAYALSAAAREAGRGYLTGTTAAEGEQRARAAADVSLRDHGLSVGDVRVRIRCSATPCLTPGGLVSVSVDTEVALPFLPGLLGRPIASIALHADHAEVVDRYRVTA